MDYPGCTLFHSYTLIRFRSLPTRSDRNFPIIVILLGTHNSLFCFLQVCISLFNRLKCLYLSPGIESHFFQACRPIHFPYVSNFLSFTGCVAQAGSQEGNKKKTTTVHHRRHYLPPLRVYTDSRLLVLSITLP
jgi:hypothetical protein